VSNQSTERPAYQGICVFCQAEVAKGKMTQHLKSCKQRFATIAAKEQKSRKPKERLFHILAEGEYSPQYWLHFEAPASASLRTLDSFLKDMWIDDLDHLSGFTINGTSYSEDYPEEFFLTEEEFAKDTKEEEEEGEITEEELREFIDETIEQFGKGPVSAFGIDLHNNRLWTEWELDLKKSRSLDDLLEFLRQERTRIDKESRSWKHEQELSEEERHQRYFILRDQRLIVNDLLVGLEDRSMEVTLARVLKVGQKFSYVYDYGSSTYVKLRVIAEREGIVQNKRKPVQLLARNIAPAFTCAECGKPATSIATGYFDEDIYGNCYCDKCASRLDEYGMLPLINSPRVGVL
jgi:hypothetical protein